MIARLVLGALLASSASARAEDVSRYKVHVVVTDAAGGTLERLKPDEAFRIRIRFTDAQTDEAARGLRPSAWLRRVTPGKPVCTEAARAVRATGRLPSDDIALAGAWLLALGEDDRLAILDPRLSSAKTNLVALAPLGERPAAVVALDHGTAAASRPAHGDVLAIDLPSGRTGVLASGLGRPGALLAASAGKLWVADDASGRLVLLDRSGRTIATADVGPGPLRVTPAGPGRLIAIAQDSAAAVLERDTGALVTRFTAGAIAGPAVATADGIVSAPPDEAALAVRYFDDPTAARRVPLDRPATGLALAPGERRVLAWSGPGRTLDVVDIADLKRLRGFESPDEVEQVGFAGQTAFIVYRTKPAVTVLDLGTVTAKEAVIRDVHLAALPGQAASSQRPVVASLAPQPSVLVSLPGSRALFEVAAGGGLATAPMTVIALRTATPVALVIADRSLSEVAPGQFEAAVKVPLGGTWEVVATTGVGGTTACATLHAEGDGPEPAMPRLVVEAERPVRAGERVELRVTIPRLGEAGDRISLAAASLDGGWRRVLSAKRGPSGEYRWEAVFPWTGPYPVSVLGRRDIAPTVIEVLP
jgi:hypothetical protein